MTDTILINGEQVQLDIPRYADATLHASFHSAGGYGYIVMLNGEDELFLRWLATILSIPLGPAGVQGPDTNHLQGGHTLTLYINKQE